MSALLVTIGHLRDDRGDALEQYAAGTIPLITAAGGEVITRASPIEAVVGGPQNRPDLVAVIRFPSADAVREFLTSGAYRANVAYRNRAFVEVHSYIATDLV